MELSGRARRVTIFVGESDKLGSRPLSEAIVLAAREAGLAGATAWRGTFGFGRTARLRSAAVLDLSTDLPVIVEIVDEAERVDAFVAGLEALFEKAGSGGLVTVEDVEVHRYFSHPG
jgi:PII-like signaling protein